MLLSHDPCSRAWDKRRSQNNFPDRRHGNESRRGARKIGNIAAEDQSTHEVSWQTELYGLLEAAFTPPDKTWNPKMKEYIRGTQRIYISDLQRRSRCSRTQQIVQEMPRRARSSGSLARNGRPQDAIAGRNPPCGIFTSTSAGSVDPHYELVPVQNQ